MIKFVITNSATSAGTAAAATDEAATAGSSSATSATMHPNSRPCRYKMACVRPDCKFWHPGRPNQTGVTVDGMLYCNYCQWLPSLLKEIVM